MCFRFSSSPDFWSSVAPQRQVRTVKIVQVSETLQQFLDKVVVVSVVQRLVPGMVQTVQKRLEVSQVQFLDLVAVVSVVQRLVPGMVQTVQKRLEVPQVQFMDSDVVVPVVERLCNGPDSAENCLLRRCSSWQG